MTTATSTTVPIRLPEGKPAAIVTVRELRDVLMGLTQHAFISLIARYNASERGMILKGGRKADNPFWGKLFKVSRQMGGVCFDYASGVERRLVKEGKDEDDWRRGESWHVPIVYVPNILTPVCVNKSCVTAADGRIDLGLLNDKTPWYLRFRKDKSESHWELADGTRVDAEAVKPWLVKRGHYKNQNLRKPLAFETIIPENLIEITVNGTVYLVRR
jgi:hypothetical protein